MQIHELTQPRKSQLDEIFGIDTVGDAIKSGGATLMPTASGQQARRSAEQGRINQQAAKAVAKLEKRLPPPEPVPTLDQALTKLKSNPAAQQWINSVVAKWPAIAQRLATITTTTATTTAKATPTTTPSTVTLGGKKLDPKNPNDAQVLAAVNKQGIKEAPEYTTPGGIVVPGGAKTAQAPAPQQANQTYANGVRQWINSALKTTSLEKLETDAEVKSKLEPLLTQIVAAKDNQTRQQELVRDFFTLAVAANHVVQAKQQDPLDPAYQGRAGSRSNLGQPMDDDQEPVDTGLSVANLYNLNQAARASGEPAPRFSTGNKWMDRLVQQIWNGR